MSSASTEDRTVSSGGRKYLYASLLILLIAGIAIYSRLTSKVTAFASNAEKRVAVRTQTVYTGALEETLRLGGSIGAERFQLVQAPQLRGIRGSSTVVGNVSTTSTPSSTPTFTPVTGSALDGSGNRFSDRKGEPPPPSTPYTPPSTAGSVYNSLVSTASLRGAGASDFNLTVLKLAEPGAHVKQGDVIAEFDRQVQLLRQDDYLDTVKQLDDNIEKMRSDLQSIRKAHEHIIFSARSDYEKAQLDLKTAEVRSANEAEGLKLNVEETKARYEQLLKEVKLLEASQNAQLHAAQIDRDQGKMELERAQHNVELMLVRAPMDGIVVLQTIYRGGDMGPAQQGDQLYSGRVFMQVIDPRSMLLNATASQVDGELIRLGMRAHVHLDAYPGIDFPGHIAGINALSKTSYRRPNFKGDIDVRIKIDAIDDTVIPDISGSADIILGSEEKQVIAPLSAIFYDSPDNRPYVYVETPAGWTRRDVTLGLRNNIQTTVRSGLAAGDVIALAPPVLAEKP
jgi:multidrug efflux pump subunit AcrA (membrane-fusion protein)